MFGNYHFIFNFLFFKVNYNFTESYCYIGSISDKNHMINHYLINIIDAFTTRES